MPYDEGGVLHELEVFDILVRAIACVDLIPSQGQRDLIPQFGKRIPVATHQCRAFQGQEHHHKHTYTDE